MKYLILFSLIFIVGCSWYFYYQEGSIRINNERAGIILFRGGYRAWWVVYSNGLKYPYKMPKDNLWCMPRFEHCDIRKLLLGWKEVK